MRILSKLADSVFASLVAIIAAEIGPPAACAQDVTTPGRIPVLRHPLSVAPERPRDDIDVARARASGEFQCQHHPSSVASGRRPVHGVVRGAL